MDSKTKSSGQVPSAEMPPSEISTELIRFRIWNGNYCWNSRENLHLSLEIPCKHSHKSVSAMAIHSPGEAILGPPAQTANPHPRLKARLSCTERRVELHLWVLQFCSSLCLFFGSEQKCPGANRPPEFVPESPLQKGVFGSHIFSKEL